MHEEFKARGIARPEEGLSRRGGAGAALNHPRPCWSSPTGWVRPRRSFAPRLRWTTAGLSSPPTGHFYKLQQQAPDKEFIIAPTAGNGAACRSCANCPWMAMNDLEALASVFDRDDNEIFVDPAVGAQAMKPCAGCWICRQPAGGGQRQRLTSPGGRCHPSAPA